MSYGSALQVETLLDWIEGRLPAAEAERVAVSIAAADEATRATVAWLRAFRETSAALVFEAPPAGTHTLLQERFAAYTRARRRPGFLRRFIATLNVESFNQPALVGMRGAAQGRQQIIFNSPVLDVALNIRKRPADQQFELSGQIFLKETEASQSLTVRLLDDDDELASAAADDLGEFELSGVAAGRYTLLLQTGATEVVIAPLELVA
jgi:hypothetical protein